ncbi:hypothetical protein FOC1_g10006835 [Fusarium oxysporum f. sp. cubense race 1]|uniref:Uncharacterized protein n=1 Tax=Fusarium oxysporum f. sp. cubense (strain race 1) TaxID=1229664 RepID=N4TRN0_FUSC1|nr:hypothetical protein FOC1_g10006835 [Fusarium oxysporum f. sp. cubense race 1]
MRDGGGGQWGPDGMSGVVDTLLLAPSSHTVQPSILDRARVRDLHASPCYSRQGKDIENMDPRGSRKQEFDLTCAGIDSVQGSLMIKGS